MNLEKALESWEDYDNRKKVREDARYFAGTEDWEVGYLVGKILKLFPNQTRDRVKGAIANCCETVRAPRPRREFVQCVLRRLALI